MLIGMEMVEVEFVRHLATKAATKCRSSVAYIYSGVEQQTRNICPINQLPMI